MNASGAPDLSRLVVIERLEVGPVKIESDRIAASYRVGEDSFELAYKYEEPVFDPQEPEASNLASVILAQVALNYGLFCREIVFHGDFDEVDRRFLTEMAANTAREIYVKKILEPNPFLTEDVAGIPAVVEKSYLASSLLFPAERPRQAARWPTSPERHCVLSSGGKDSLLTFGLLREIGVETHPIFVNESGRHWFTALNAYRHFALKIPDTARVWTNSDRLFSWMLRQLPFVRKDFQSRALRRLSDSAVDRRGVPFRSPAAPAQARHRTASHRRRVRHHRKSELPGDHPLQRPLRSEPLLRRGALALLRAEGMRNLPVLDPAALLRDPDREGPRRALPGAARAPDVLPRDAQGRGRGPSLRRLREVPAHRGDASRRRPGPRALRLSRGADRELAALRSSRTGSTRNGRARPTWRTSCTSGGASPSLVWGRSRPGPSRR